MKGNAQILNLDRKCIQFILENHELFSPEEVRIAAKRQVDFDRQYEAMVRHREMVRKYELESLLSQVRRQLG
jgi:hypothetical protein